METSEKTIERYLCDKMASIGGIALKYTSDLRTGYPTDSACYPTGGSSG